MNQNNNSKSKGALVPEKVTLIAQGALEYLLIIGAAILVVAIVIVAITGVLGTGKSNVNTESTDSTYTGLRDIIDLGKGQSRIFLTLKPGENIFEFESIVGARDVWSLFGKLPEGTKIEFTAENICVNNTNLVNATKTNLTYLQNLSGNANNCIVPINEQVKITLPQNVEEQKVEIITEEEKEPYTILTPDNERKWLNKIIENPNGKFKLSQGINTVNRYQIIRKGESPQDYENLLKSIKFSGILEGANQRIEIPINSDLSETTNFIFGEVNNATINNLQIYKFTTTSNNEVYISSKCNPEENKFNNITRIAYFNFLLPNYDTLNNSEKPSCKETLQNLIN